MVQDKELENLRKQLASRKRILRQVQFKYTIEQEKTRLRKEIFLLKHPKKIELAKRFGRGLKITGRKVGSALIKQGKLIAQQQERDRRLEIARGRMRKRKVNVRKGSGTDGFNPLGNLDF